MEKYEIKVPTKKIQTLIEALLKGTPLKYACDKAMLPMFYIYRWQKLYDEFLIRLENGEEDESLLEPPVDKNDILIYNKLNALTISAIIKNARAEYLEKLQENMKVDNDRWQKWAWLLERCFKDTYGKEETTKATATVEKITVQWVDPKTEDNRLNNLEEEVRKALK